MGNCIISSKTKRKKTEVYRKRLPLEESIKINNTLTEKCLFSDGKNEMCDLNDDEITNGNEIISQSKIEEIKNDVFTMEDNENIEINLPCDYNTSNLSEKSSSSVSLPSYETPVGTPILKERNFLNDDRPIQPMPTPFRTSGITPGRNIEKFFDRQGRLRKDYPIQMYLARKRRENLFGS